MWGTAISGEFSWVGAMYCPHPSPLPKGEGATIFPLPLGEGAIIFPLPLGEGAIIFPLPLGEGQRVREEKNKENAQIGRLYTNLTFDNRPTPLPFFSRLFFISRPLFLALLFRRGRVRRTTSFTSNQSAKCGGPIHIIPYNCAALVNPLYNVSSTSNQTGFPLKYCGNDDGGVLNVVDL